MGTLFIAPPSAWRVLGVSPISIEVKGRTRLSGWSLNLALCAPGSSCRVTSEDRRGLCCRPRDKAAAGFVHAAFENIRTPSLACEQKGMAGWALHSATGWLGRGIRALREATGWNGTPFVRLVQAYRLASSYLESSVEFSSIHSADI